MLHKKGQMVTSCLPRKFPKGCHTAHPFKAIGQGLVTWLHPAAEAGPEAEALQTMHGAARATQASRPRTVCSLMPSLL